MSWGWDQAMSHYRPADDDDVSDEQLIATLNQAGNWHCTKAARRIAELKAQMENTP